MKAEIQINVTQLEEMRHTIGLKDAKKPKPYRNRFYTESNDANWNDLVTKGLATKRKGWEEDMAYFQLTLEGAKIVMPSITKEVFEDL